MREEYYEGILQLRNPSDDVMDFVAARLRKSPKIHVAKEVQLKTGVDVYVSSQKWLLQLAKKLKESFPGVLKTSRKLQTVKRQTGKRLYRVNVLFRSPHFKKGQVLTVKGEKVKVISIGSKVIVQDVSSGKKVRYDFETVDQAALLED